jgi:AraC-like DNA-binding protein
VLVSLHRSGSGSVEQYGRTARLVPGAAALYDASAPYTLSFPGQMSEIVLQLPRETISSVGHAFEDLTARVLHPSGPLKALVALAGAVDPGEREGSAASDGAVAESLASLLRAALTSEPPSEAPPVEAELLALALRLHVDEHAADPHLTPESLAAEFHISLRYAQKLFSRDGDAPASYIRLRRLELAQRHLRAGSSVSEAAYRSGFLDVDTFSRAFKREFGIAPSRLGSDIG